MTTGSISYGNGSTDSYSRSWSGGDGKYSFVNGVRVANWHNYNMSISSMKGSPGKGGPAYWLQITCLNDLVSVTEQNGTGFKAQSNLVSRIKGHEFNLGVAVAEGSKTVSMAVSALQTVAGSLHDLRRGNFSSAARRLGLDSSGRSALKASDVSGRFLELQYGWLPLLTDVHEAAKAFHLASASPRSSVIRASSTAHAAGSSICSPSTGSASGKHTFRYSYLAELTEDLSTPRVLGLEDPLLIAWELVPYSFVIDWFLPIGTYLENLNMIPKLNGRFLTMRSSLKEYSGRGKTGTNWQGASESGFDLTYQRTASTSLTAARPSFKSLPAAMSPQHIYNAVALGHQRVTSTRRDSVDGSNYHRQGRVHQKSLQIARLFTGRSLSASD